MKKYPEQESRTPIVKSEENQSLRLPKEVPADFLNMVSQLLNFIEHVDEIKSKNE